jgi:predicted helicase
MRKHLYNTFDEIYILNLHGNTRKKEGDKNIFDIMVGVSIIFLVKHKKSVKKKIVKYFSTFENRIMKRQEKLDFLTNSSITNVKWKTLHPEKDDFYWFVNKDMSHQKEYKKFWKVTEIFAHYNSGIQTKNDNFTIQYSKKQLDNIVDDIKRLYPNQISEKYNVENSRDWTIEKAKDDILNCYNPKWISYRPFDYRITSLSQTSKSFIAYPRYQTNKHFENENIGLVFTRNIDKNYSDVFIADKPIDIHVVSGQNYLAPLWYYNGGNGYAEMDFDGYKRYANFTPEFIKKYIEKIKFQVVPEEVLAYIYAVLHSNVYRTKYLEFLKTDFPAVPMTTNKDAFYKYSKLGQKLIDLHLFNNIPYDTKIRVDFDIDGDFVIEKISHNDNILSLFTTDNKRITFEGIDKNIYNFEIGSYKPIEKWLKYRIKDKVSLSTSDLQHIKNMIIALKNTILTMQEIESLGEEYLKL